MAIDFSVAGTDFVVYHDEVNGAMVEATAQEVATLNVGGAGAFQITTSPSRGDYDKESFFKRGAGVQRRDPDSVADITDVIIAQDEEIGVKLSRNYTRGAARNAWLKIATDPSTLSGVYGQMLGPEILEEQVNTSLAACSAAISGITSKVYDPTTTTSTETMTHSYLNTALSKMGDKAGQVRLIVMHSKPYHDLIEASITSTAAAFGAETAGGALAQGTPLTFGRPVFVTDSSSLVVSGTPDHYVTLGLTRGAIKIKMTEPVYTKFEEKTGQQNIFVRAQSEYAYNLGLRGFKWDVANGGKNPDASTVATQTNWDQVATDDKHLTGVRLLTE